MDEIKFFKLRKLTTNNSTGDAFGITIPREIARPLLYVNFKITRSGNNILLESGCPHGRC